MTQAELDSDSNLLVLCKRDHKLVDDQPNHYTIEKLRRIKAEHRKRINSLREGQRRGAGQAEKVARGRVSYAGGHTFPIQHPHGAHRYATAVNCRSIRFMSSSCRSNACRT
jgi:hypothetical protein